MSLTQFLELYGTEEQYHAALEVARWPDGFRCPRCGAEDHGHVNGRRHRRYQGRSCRHQITVTAGTIMEATKLPLTKWVPGLLSDRGRKNRYITTLAEKKVGRQLPDCLACAQQDYAGNE